LGLTVVDPGLAGGEQAVASGLAQGVAAAMVLVVGGDVADAGVQPDGVVLLADRVQLQCQLGGVVDLLQVRPVGLDVPEQTLVPGLVGGVPGRPKRCMIAQAAMNSFVECERIWDPVSLIAISTGRRQLRGPSSSAGLASPQRSRASSRASMRSASRSAVNAAVNATSICTLVCSAETRVDSQRRETTSMTATATRLAQVKWVKS